MLSTALLLLSAHTTLAADTVEAFDLGVTDLELHATYTRPRLSAPSTEATVVLGAGLHERLAVNTALTLDPFGGPSSAFAGVGAWVGLIPGEVAMDLLVELGWGVGSGPGEWGMGLEIDDRRRRYVPYMRMMAWGEGTGEFLALEPVVGLARMPGEAVFQPHLELSTTVGPEGMGTPVLCFGPNMVLAEQAELVPDFSIGLGKDCDCGWAATLGVIITMG